LRVLILNFEFPPLGGGAGNATAELVRALQHSPEIEVVVVTSSTEDFYVERKTFSQNSTIYYLPIGKNGQNPHYQTNQELLKYNVRCHAFLRDLLLRESFDICHAIMTLPAGLNAWLIRKRMPYLVSLQGSDVPWYSERFKLIYPILTPIIRRIWTDSAAVISNSDALRELALRSAPTQSIGVVPNGIDQQLFSPDGSPDTQKRRIICVGRLIERKGVWELLEAMPRILATIPNAHLDFVGTGNLEAQLRDRIQEIGLTESVSVHGPVPHDELPDWLRKASVFTLPSHAEGMSNALLEGIACGLPIVVTDTGGTSELLDGNGLVVPIKNADAIATAVIEILSDDRKREDMRHASLRIANKYSWQTMAKTYLEYYREISAHSGQADLRGSLRTQ